MTKCPECDKEIDHLREYNKVWQLFRFQLTPTGDPESIDLSAQEETLIPTDESEYECPECENIIFPDEDKAWKFLKGG